MTPEQELFYLEGRLEKFHESIQEQLNEEKNKLKHTKLGCVYLTTLDNDKLSKGGVAVHIDQEDPVNVFVAIKEFLQQTGLEGAFHIFMMK